MIPARNKLIWQIIREEVGGTRAQRERGRIRSGKEHTLKHTRNTKSSDVAVSRGVN